MEITLSSSDVAISKTAFTVKPSYDNLLCISSLTNSVEKLSLTKSTSNVLLVTPQSIKFMDDNWKISEEYWKRMRQTRIINTKYY